MKLTNLLKLLMVVAASIFCHKLAHADSIVVLAGTDVSSHSDYTYIGGISYLGHPGNESGILAKVWVDHLWYEYPGYSGMIKANSDGEQVALGYQWIRPTGYITTYIGIGSRDTNCTYAIDTHTQNWIPDIVMHDILSSKSGRLTGLVTELDLAQNLEKNTVFDGIINYTERSEDYWSRFRLLKSISGILKCGPEFVLQGNPSYSATRFGIAIAEVHVGHNVFLNVNAGYGKTRGLNGAAYVGVSVAHPL